MWLRVLQLTRSLGDIRSAPHDALFAELRTHGALVLRPPCEETAETFSAFAQALQLRQFDASESAAVRSYVAPHVWTANEAPHDAPVPFHHEMAQCSSYPRYVLFFCETPPEAGGNTLVALSDALARQCRRRFPEACDELDRRGIRYVRTLPKTDDAGSPIGRAWSTAFNSTNRVTVELRLHYRQLQGQWLNDESLQISTSGRSVFKRFGAEPEVFFNSAVAARAGWRDSRNSPHTTIRFGDDGSLLSESASAVFDFAEAWLHENAVHVPWRAGDVLLLDNHRVMHARETYTPPRRILASLWGERKVAATSISWL